MLVRVDLTTPSLILLMFELIPILACKLNHVRNGILKPVLVSLSSLEVSVSCSVLIISLIALPPSEIVM